MRIVIRVSNAYVFTIFEKFIELPARPLRFKNNKHRFVPRGWF